jgi:hypothetical protein
MWNLSGWERHVVALWNPIRNRPRDVISDQLTIRGLAVCRSLAGNWTGSNARPCVRMVRRLLPFKHEDVRFISACGVNANGQRLKVGGKLDLLTVVDFAVALLIR